MELSFLKLKHERTEFEIIFINLIIQLYIFRTVIPILKYPFLPFYFLFVLYVIISYRDTLKARIKNFLRNYIMIILLFIILCYAAFLSEKIYLIIIKDIFNIIILLSFFFILTIIINTKKEFNFLVINMINFIILFSVIISTDGLLKLFDIGSIYTFSGEIDYNFALLPVFFGTIGVLFKLMNSKLAFHKVCYNLLLSVFFLKILFSGSRRGIILIVGILVLLLIAQFIVLFNKSIFIKKISVATRGFFVSITLMTGLLYAFVFHTSVEFKDKSLEVLGSKDIFYVKKQIVRRLLRYSSKLSDEKVLFNKLWGEMEFNPLYPESGWGFHSGKRVFPLTGSIVKMIPPKVVGCMMDSTCYGSSYWEEYHYVIYKRVHDIKVKKNEKYKGSIYCFASNDFEGTGIRIGVPGMTIRSKIVTSTTPGVYNLENKGTWQKLDFEFNCNEGVVPIFLSIVADMEMWKMKGYAILAYPQIFKVDLNGNIRYIDSDDTDTIEYDKCKPNYKSKSLLFQSNLIKPLISNINASIISGSFLYFSNINAVLIEKDLIRKSMNKFISEDTTYYCYQNDLKIDTVFNKFSGPRINRWRFARQIFTKEYNWKQKFFGGGFNFLNWYGYYFKHDKIKSDWPHNPFLSVLLYSGLVGLIIYIIVLSRAIILYLKYRKRYFILFIFFLITFFFAFFSVNSPFTPPIWGFFLMMPYFIHAIYKKEISEEDKIDLE